MPWQGSADNALARVLPLFADATPEAGAWRADAGIGRVDAGDAEVIRDPALCARIGERARAWHVRSGYAPVLGDYTVHALRMGPWYAAVANHSDESGPGLGVLLILDPADLRVHDFAEL